MSLEFPLFSPLPGKNTTHQVKVAGIRDFGLGHLNGGGAGRMHSGMDCGAGFRKKASMRRIRRACNSSIPGSHDRCVVCSAEPNVSQSRIGKLQTEMSSVWRIVPQVLGSK